MRTLVYWGGLFVLSVVLSQQVQCEENAVQGCRKVADAVQRLTCFDAAAALEGPQVTDAPEPESAAAGSQQGFGLRPPRTATASTRLQGVIRSARATAEGWLITLEDGSVWRQVDARASNVEPKAGQPVTIEHAALGAFRLMLSRNLGLKVQRVR